MHGRDLMDTRRGEVERNRVTGGSETSAESAGADSDAGKDAPLPQHNTMADLAMNNPEACDLPFGEYMLRKWEGVQRSGVGGSGEGDEKPPGVAALLGDP